MALLYRRAQDKRKVTKMSPQSLFPANTSHLGGAQWYKDVSDCTSHCCNTTT